MQYDKSAAGDHISIHVDDPGLPDDSKRDEELISDLKCALTTILEEYELNSNQITIWNGHTYSLVPRTCPICGERLTITNPEIVENAVYAEADCDCGWHGDANYRLIDLEDGDPAARDVESTSEYDLPVPFGVTSSVRLHDHRVNYGSY